MKVQNLAILQSIILGFIALAALILLLFFTSCVPRGQLINYHTTYCINNALNACRIAEQAGYETMIAIGYMKDGQKHCQAVMDDEIWLDIGWKGYLRYGKHSWDTIDEYITWQAAIERWVK